VDLLRELKLKRLEVVIPIGDPATLNKECMNSPTAYIMTNQRNGTLYVGVTSNLVQRVWQHKSHVADGFTKKYKITMLVYFEQALTMESAILREKEMKGLSRKKKIFLIEERNPYWIDLYDPLL
jgi:putative endonuclease